MAKGVKTDNHNPAAKLALRRHFLGKYHGDGAASVLDCCQGGGLIWGVLRREFIVPNYWGIDLKPKKGRLKLDSVRVLQQPGWSQNIIDIDTYGSPWKHWLAMLPNIVRPTTVFLTLGQLQTGTVGSVGDAAIKAAGLTFPTLKLPQAFHVKLRDTFPSFALGQASLFGIMIIEALEAVSNGNARYFGLRLEPGK